MKQSDRSLVTSGTPTNCCRLVSNVSVFVGQSCGAVCFPNATRKPDLMFSLLSIYLCIHGFGVFTCNTGEQKPRQL